MRKSQEEDDEMREHESWDEDRNCVLVETAVEEGIERRVLTSLRTRTDHRCTDPASYSRLDKCQW
jgi:hypothetical protein